MTNKPMLSVERELLERVSATKNMIEFLEAMDELRALLDKPEYPRVEIVKAHTHTCACVVGDSGVCDCGAVVNGVCVKVEPAAQHQGYPVNRLSYSQGDLRYVNGWNDACSHWEVRSAPEAHESECTSCDGSGEYTDAIGDWRGYCTCPAGVDAEGIKGLKP